MRKNVILENLIRQGVKECLNNRLKEDKSWSNLFGLNNDVAPDDDKGQRSLDPYEMKKMRGYFTNNKISKDEKNNNEFFDASGYKLCGKFKSNLGINLDIIFKLLNNLVDILEENENATVMTISPYSVEIAKKTYYKDPGNNLRLFVICLDVQNQLIYGMRLIWCQQVMILILFMKNMVNPQNLKVGLVFGIGY